MGRCAAYEAGVEPRPLHVQILRGPDTTAAEGVEQSVVQTRLFADAARAAGMRVSDEAVVQYSMSLVAAMSSRDEMRTMLTGMQARRRLSIDDVFGVAARGDAGAQLPQ